MSSVRDLTPLQEQVMRLLFSGLTRKKVAERLDLSLYGVERAVEFAYVRLGASNRTEAYRLWVERGLDKTRS